VLPALSAPKAVKEFTDDSGFIPVSFPSFSYNERIFALGDSAKGMVGPKTIALSRNF
jgi:sulfide:quinone oxidoreductase